MSHADLQDELLRLRKQVEALSAARRKQQAQAEFDQEEPDPVDDDTDSEHAIQKQIEELIQLLREEVRDMPAMPTLAVFMLGILVGRYLR